VSRSSASRSAPAGRSTILDLQAAAGNRAVAGVLAPQALQRAPHQPGWSDADKRGQGWNAGDHVEWGIHRVPIDGLTLGNQRAFSGDHKTRSGEVEPGEANERAKTTESGAGRAIVLVPTALAPKRPVAVLLHLHGYTSRDYDPYAGWRQHGRDQTVRDVALDRIEQQMQAVNDPQLIGVLPQGVGHSEFGDLNPDSYVDEVMRRLAKVASTNRIPVPDLGKGYRLVLSAHSGGGHTVRRVLEQEGRSPGKGRPPGVAPAEVVLFEAINNPDELAAVKAWVDHHLDRTLAEFKRAQQAGDQDGQAKAIAACPTLRAYRSTSRSYRATYNNLDEHIRRWFADHARDLGPFAPRLQDHFRVAVLTGTAIHEQTVRGLGDDPAGGPLADALGALADPSRPSKLEREAPRRGHAAPKPKAATHQTAASQPAAHQTAAHQTATSQPAAHQTPPPRRPTGPPTTNDFVHDTARTTLELLPAADRARFEAINWNGLDYPGAKMEVKDTSEENLAKWRADPDYVLFQTKDKHGVVHWFIKGVHQKEAQSLLDALARVRPGGGERRANLGATAVLTADQYHKDPARFDEYIGKQLGSIRSYDLGSMREMHENALNKHAAEQFAKLVDAAAADGVYISVNNSFRTRKKAETNAAKSGNAKAVAKYSSHSLGLAVDLNLWTAAMGKRLGETATAMPNTVRMLGAPAYKWMFERGAEFGFYQYRNEPWHWEYNPPGFRETFWAEAADLAPAPEPAPAHRSKRHG
jgi:hypothetical protein